MLHSIVLASSIQQHESAISIHMFPLPTSYPVSSLHLCFTITFHYPSILHMVIYMFQCYCLNLSPPLLPPLCPESVLYVCVRTWKQHECPLTDEWIKKLWYIYTVKYYSVIKGNSFESVLVSWMNLEPVIYRVK